MYYIDNQYNIICSKNDCNILEMQLVIKKYRILAP